jgi:raffinose/stachyose/melibiose transport system permease protein
MDQFCARLDRRSIGTVAAEQRRDDRLCGNNDLFDLFDGGLYVGAPDRTRLTLDQRIFARHDDNTFYLFPLYFGFAHLGLIDNVFALSFVYTAVFSPFAIFLLRTYYLAIPKELEEAAIIDGANRWQVFTKVLLPLVSPGILTVAIISGLNIWNEFLISSTFLQSHDQQTAVVRFYTLGGQYTSDWGEIMAAAILIVAPAVGFFLLMQRRFIQGMAAGSVKG